MRLTESPHLSHLAFDTYTEAISFAQAKASDCEAASRRDRETVEFTDTHSYAAAHQLATAGWAAGRKAIQPILNRIQVTGHVLKPEVYYDVVGDGGVDVGLALAGVPECFLAWRDSEDRQANPHGPIVRIGFNGSIAGIIDTATILHRGAAVLALIDALEQSGRRVEVTYYKHNAVGAGDVGHFLIEVPLKTAEYALQPDQLVFALTHPSMNRRIGFSLTQQCGKYGAASVKRSFGAAPTTPRPETDIWLPRLDLVTATTFAKVEDAHNWVREQLISQGVTLEDTAH